MGFSFLLLKCGLHVVSFFKEHSIERGMVERESHVIVEKPNKHHFSQVLKVNVNRKPRWYYVTLIGDKNDYLPLWFSSPQKTYPLLKYEKNQTNSNRGTTHKILGQYSSKVSRSSKPREVSHSQEYYQGELGSTCYTTKPIYWHGVVMNESGEWKHLFAGYQARTMGGLCSNPSRIPPGKGF